MALAPMYHESLKILDHHGAIRANTKHYMAWGSDSLFRGYSLGFWGDNEYNADILDIAQKNGFPLICAYGNDCETNLHYTGNDYLSRYILEGMGKYNLVIEAI